jgi:hypothetical protein
VKSLLAIFVLTAFAASAQTTVRIHAGGGAYTDSNGNLWAVDANFTGGNTFSTSHVIANTTDQPLYQTERWGNAVYNISVPDGPYKVTLKYSENFFTAPGQRVFDVLLNGTKVEAAFDIFAAAGSAFTAVDKSYTVTASGGTGITLSFNAITDNPKIDAIQVVSQSTTFTDAEFITPLRVHVGTTTATDASGQPWMPDAPYAGAGTTVQTYGGSITGPFNPALYQAVRVGCQSLSYSIPIPTGRYRLTFKFSEFTAVRKMDITVNGATLVRGFSTTLNAAVDKVYYVTTSASPLAITLSGAAYGSCASLAGLEVVPQIAITEADITGLQSDISQRAMIGPGYGAGVAVITSSGQLSSAVGTPGTCVMADGTTGPCGGQTPNFADGEVPLGTADGTNTVFGLQYAPSPASSLNLLRNGMAMKAGVDYTLTGSTISFIPAATPQPGDVLQAFYRH